MAIIINHMSITLRNGARTFGPALIPDGLSSITLRLARSTTLTPLFWPLAATRIIVDMEISTDGGTTFRDACGMSAVGGIAFHREGEATESVVMCQPLPAGVARQVRVLTTVTDGPLVSELTVEVT